MQRLRLQGVVAHVGRALWSESEDEVQGANNSKPGFSPKSRRNRGRLDPGQLFAQHIGAFPWERPLGSEGCATKKSSSDEHMLYEGSWSSTKYDDDLFGFGSSAEQATACNTDLDALYNADRGKYGFLDVFKEASSNAGGPVMIWTGREDEGPRHPMFEAPCDEQFFSGAWRIATF